MKFKLLFIFILLIVVALEDANAWKNNTGLPMREMHALEDLFLTTNGSRWLWLKNHHAFGIQWNFTRSNDALATFIHDPCTENWQGLSCTCNITVFHAAVNYYDDGDDYYSSPLPTTSCFIDSLYLPGHNLCGRIAPSISNLTLLQHLHLENNSISGSFIPQLCELPNLLGLHLSLNKMTNSIPSCIYKLSSLKELTLSKNQISRQIPTTIGLLRNLTTINLYLNTLTGPITALGDLRNLITLDLGSNSFVGSIPESIGLNKRLSSLGESTQYL